MNLAAMKLFCDVVRCRSFSEAALANGISQSAASQSVSQIEQELGVQLIDRTKRPFILTGEGEICYSGFSEILHRRELITADIQALRQDISGLVRVVAIYSVGLYDMHPCMQAFMARYPKARVKLQYLLPDRVYQAVLAEEADLGIVSYPVSSRDLVVIPLHTEPMVMVCHPQHHLAGRPSISLQELQGENFVPFDRTLAICRDLDNRFRERRITVRKVMEFDNVETIKQAIEIGVGISILPLPTVKRELAIGSLKAISIADETIERPIGMIHRQRKAFAPVISKFIEVLRDSLGVTGTTR